MLWTDGYDWTDRLRLLQEAPLAKQPIGPIEKLLDFLNIPEIATILAFGVLAALLLEGMGQNTIARACRVLTFFTAGCMGLARFREFFG